MSAAVTVAEAKLFLRVTQDAEDQLIAEMIAAAQARVEAEIGDEIDGDSAPGLRLAVLQGVAHAYAHRGEARTGVAETPALATHRPVRL